VDVMSKSEVYTRVRETQFWMKKVWQLSLLAVQLPVSKCRTYIDQISHLYHLAPMCTFVENSTDSVHRSKCHIPRLKSSTHQG
jgi:hypothetical protein